MQTSFILSDTCPGFLLVYPLHFTSEIPWCWILFFLFQTTIQLMLIYMLLCAFVSVVIHSGVELQNCQAGFVGSIALWNGYSNLPFHQQCKRDSDFTHPHQHWKLSVFCQHDAYKEVCFYCVIWISLVTDEVEHFFTWLLSNCASCELVLLFDHFSVCLPFFALQNSLHILDLVSHEDYKHFFLDSYITVNFVYSFSVKSKNRLDEVVEFSKIFRLGYIWNMTDANFVQPKCTT